MGPQLLGEGMTLSCLHTDAGIEAARRRESGSVAAEMVGVGLCVSLGSVGGSADPCLPVDGRSRADAGGGGSPRGGWPTHRPAMAASTQRRGAAWILHQTDGTAPLEADRPRHPQSAGDGTVARAVRGRSDRPRGCCLPLVRRRDARCRLRVGDCYVIGLLTTTTFNPNEAWRRPKDAIKSAATIFGAAGIEPRQPHCVSPATVGVDRRFAPPGSGAGPSADVYWSGERSPAPRKPPALLSTSQAAESDRGRPTPTPVMGGKAVKASRPRGCL